MDRIKNLSLDQKAKLYYMALLQKGMIDTLPEDPKAAYVRDMMDKMEEGHSDAENEKLKKISKQLKKSVKSHDKQAKTIDKITKESNDPEDDEEQAEYDKGWYGESLKEAASKLGYLSEEYSKIEQEWDKLSSDEHQSIIDDVLSGEARFNDYEKDFDELKSDYGSEFTSAIADYVGLNEEENYQNLPKPDKINLSYTDPGFRFYGMYLYKDGNRFAKISYEDRATKYLKNLGVKTEIPRSFDTDILDKIKQEIEALGIKGDYDAAMDVS